MGYVSKEIEFKILCKLSQKNIFTSDICCVLSGLLLKKESKLMYNFYNTSFVQSTCKIFWCK